MPSIRPEPTSTPLPSPKPRTKLWLLVGIILLGAFLRLHQIDTLPPGDSYDPAYYGVDALEILAGARPVYLQTNFGREVLFSYLTALFVSFLGPDTLGIHLASAFVGILTIPATYLVAQVILAKEKGVVRHYGPLLAALVMSLSYWHLNWSRFGVRAILVPLFVSLTVFVLWRGFQTLRRTWFVVTGLLLGLSLYTYQPARLLPVLILLGFIYTHLARRSFSRGDAFNVVITFGLAALVVLPMAYFAWLNPGSFNERTQQALVLGNPEQPIGEQLLAVVEQAKGALLTFGVEGYSDPLVTIPGRPSLNPFFFPAFLVGLLISLWRIKRPNYLFLLTWLGLMLLPALVAGLASPAKRAIGTLPAVTILITIGLLFPLQSLFEPRRLNAWARPAAWVFALLAAAGLLYSAVATYRDYFLVWGQDPGLAGHFQVDHTEVGRYIGSLPPEEAVFLSPFSPDHASILFHSSLRPGVRGYNGHFCLIYPSPTSQNTTYVVVPGKTESSLAGLAEHFPQGGVVASLPRPTGNQPFYTAYRVPAGAQPRLAPQHPLEASWNDEIRLLGYDLDSDSYTPGDEVTLTLYYQAADKLATNYTAFVHVVGEPHPDTGSVLWGQSDSEPCKGTVRTADWRAGEIIADTVSFAIAPDAPPGAYQLTVGFYTWPDIVRMPVVNTGGETLGDHVVLQSLSVNDASP